MTRTAARLVRTGLAATALTAGTVLAAGQAAPAQAATVHPDGYVTQISCTGASGRIDYHPGIWQETHAETATLSATLNGCSDFTGRTFTGPGSLSANLSGTARSTAGTISGDYVINWPTGSGFNPTVGKATVNLTTGTLTLSGSTSTTTGAFRGSVVGTGFAVTGHTGAGTRSRPTTSQTLTNTLPLTVRHNGG
jgi:hypothetical protein